MTPLLDLHLAGVGVRIDLDPALAATGEELAGLWAHSVRTGDDADDAPAVELRYRAAGGAAGADPDAVPDTPAELSARPLLEGPSTCYTVSGDVTRAVIEALIGTRLLLHSAVVDHPRQGVVLLVGGSGAGKSTATTVLGREGRYLSDELAVLDPADLTVTGYPKPVSRADHDLPGAPKRDHALGPLGLEPAGTAGAPDLVVLLDRITAADDAEAVPGAARIPLHRALPRLIEQSSSLWRLPSPLSTLADLADRAGGVVRVRYREAAELEELLAAVPGPVAEERVPIPPPAPVEPGPGRYAPIPLAEALMLPEGLLLLDEGRSILVQGVTALVVDMLLETGEASTEEIEAHLVETMGEHPHSRDFVEASLAELSASRWVRRG